MPRRWTSFQLLSKLEGIIPALESAHAMAAAEQIAPTMGKNKLIIVNLSGRGDKDIPTIAKMLGVAM
jgi:tryptophan synthase beta chain